MKNNHASLARGVTAVLLAAVGLHASAARASCTDAAEVFVTTVSRTFSKGSAWTFNVVRKQCEGLVIDSASFTPAGGAPMKVLARGNIAEIHTASLTGTPRNFDVTLNSEGLGDTNTAGTSFAATLSSVECEGPGPTNGQALFDGNRICVMNEDGDYRYRGGLPDANQDFWLAERVVVFMSSQVGKENYINRWEFNDEGTIDVAFGVTGRVPFTKSSTSYAAYGSRLDKSSNTTPRIGLAHLHNVYYRLDLDIGDAANDVVSRRLFAPTTTPPDSTRDCSVAGSCGVSTTTAITKETEQSWSPTGQTAWVISDVNQTNTDGRHIGYELVPAVQGIWRGMTSTTEPWAGSELWVTKFSGCELFALKNATPALPSSCGTPKANVHVMANDESLAGGADLVVWYANRMLHDVRDEDETNMPIRWTRFELAPRSFNFQDPLESPAP